MGNKLARTTQASASEYYLHDLPSECNLVLKEVLGTERFIKSVLCVHDEGLVIVKVYFKRGEVNLQDHAVKLQDLRTKLKEVPHSHVLPFEKWYETDKAAYLLRQYLFSNLHDRISTRPFLSTIEKKWLTYQLLHAVKQCHDMGFCHGDIKCENVVLTSWNWVFLTDFAPFKPTYIPDDNPADFSFYFDTGGQRRCYLAPERFVDSSHGNVDGPLHPSMDMFSLGCVIAELFMEGQFLFDLAKLVAYRKNAFDPKPIVEKQISDSGIRNMVLQMIHMNPESRLCPKDYLETWGYDVFPKYFSPALHSLFSCLSGLDTDTRISVVQQTFPAIRGQIIDEAKSAELELDLLDRSGGRPSTSEGSDKASVKSMHSVSRQDLVNDITLLLKEDNSAARKQYRPQFPKSSVGCTSRAKAAAIVIAEATSAQEVVTEKVYENVLRDANGTDQGIYTGDTSELKGICRRKEDISLPVEGGWIWEGDWEIDHGWSSVDTDGWRYNDQGPLLSEASKARQWPIAWNPVCKPNSFWKQRLWTRRRRRTPSQALLFSTELFSEGKVLDKYKAEKDVQSEGMVLVAAVLCACLRNAKQPQAKRAAIQLLNDASVVCDDDARLQLIVPFVASLLSDPAAIVRCATLQTLCDVLSMVESFSPSDTKVFPEYIFPLLSMLPEDPEESVRVTYAKCISKFASTGLRFLDLQYSGLDDREKTRLAAKYDIELTQLRETIARVIHDLVMGPKQTPLIRRALLQDVRSLCTFFGKKQCNDFLLPILPAFLNDRDKLLRAVFFEQIVYVCIFVGPISSEAYLLPYLEQATSNAEETVVVNALECLAALVLRRLLRKRTLLKTLERTAPLLCHPSQFVRRATATLVAASGSSLERADAYAYLWPLLLPFLKRKPAALSSEAALLACLKPPLTREVFQRALSDATAEQVRTPSDGSKAWLKSPKHKNQQQQVADAGDDIKMRAMQGYIQNLSSTMHSWDMEHPEKKLENGGAFISSNDASTDCIPIYSVAINEKANEDWNRVNPHGPFESLISSQWATVPPTDSLAADVLQKSTLTLPPRLSTSIYGGARRGHANESGPAVSVLGSKSMAWPAFDAPTSHRLPAAEQTGEPSTAAYFKFLKSAGEICWKPRGVLVAHLQEHQGAVNEVAVSADGTFFASGSDDGTVNIWDCRRLERDISFRSRLRYSFESGRVLRLAMLVPDYQVAAASSTGQIHVFCVDYTARAGNSVERYSGLSNVRKVDAQEGSVLSLQAFSPNGGGSPMLLYSTQHNGIHLWDFRTQADAWLLKGKAEEGYISGVAVDPARKWIVSGTSRGVMTLWDLRFQVPVFSWQLPCGDYVEAITVPCSTTLTRPFVYVAAGRDEISVWNAENGTCQQVLTTTEETPSALHQRSSKPAKLGSDYRVQELSDPPKNLPGARTLLPVANGAAVISGATDCKIRFWDHSRPDCSYCMCGPTTTKGLNNARYVSRSIAGVNVTQEVVSLHSGSTPVTSGPALAATDTVGCHHDSITSLALATAQTNLHLLISSSRDGVIKVWK